MKNKNELEQITSLLSDQFKEHYGFIREQLEIVTSILKKMVDHGAILSVEERILLAKIKKSGTLSLSAFFSIEMINDIMKQMFPSDQQFTEIHERFISKKKAIMEIINHSLGIPDFCLLLDTIRTSDQKYN